jgi:pimeloyl-ACP methyl ester carboxylesterase
MADPLIDDPASASKPLRSKAATATPRPEAMEAYQPIVDSRSEFVNLRGLRHHLRVWETEDAEDAATVEGTEPPGRDADAPTLLLLHGWMDVSASFQFVVDALRARWRVVAPDWRGFGLTEASPGRDRVDSYAFADYLGDLDALLDHLSPEEPVRVVAHSMGGNVALLYAGIRPQRVAGLVNLEGFGLQETDPTKAVRRYRQWLDELKAPASLRPYASLDEVAARLMKTNARLPIGKARFLAQHWAQPLRPAEPGGGGHYGLRADPAHRRINPVPYRVDEALSCWAAAEAPILWVTARDRDSFHQFTRTENYRRRLAVIRRLREVEVADAGHMLHHDQPGIVAGLIEEFFSR